MEIHFPIDCTIEHADELHKRLLDALESSDARTILYFDTVETVDMSFFQLVYATIRSFKERGKALTVKSKLSTALAGPAARMGLPHIAVAAAADEARR
jgi:hypothetical protein